VYDYFHRKDAMPSLQAKISRRIIKLKRYSWARGTIVQQRWRQEKAARWFPISREIEITPVNINGLSAAWFSGSEPRDGVVLYLHGGAFALGSINSHREYLGRFAGATRLKVMAIDYRLAPEHPFPAALEDAVCAYRWLLSQGLGSSQIVIAGDSAGGGLALATMLALRDAGDPLPVCGVCISPWVDLTLSSESIQSKASADPLLSPEILDAYAEYYAGDNEKRHDLISPLFADLAGLSPLLIHVGSEEILLDEALHFYEKACAAGVEVRLKTWAGLFHVFQIVPFLPETKASLEQIATFIVSHIKPCES
jgi:acetyl esterase/lipase